MDLPVTSRPASEDEDKPALPLHKPSPVPALLLAFAGLAMVVARHLDSTAETLDTYVSLHGLPPDVQIHLDDVLLVPLAAVLVVFCRVTLGLRMLGPFRPVLIAVAFAQTGVWLGLVFLCFVLTIVAVLRPRLRNAGLPYFARLSMLLSSVVVIELIVLIAGSAAQNDELVQVAFFPIIVLCLTADGFARVLSEEGLSTAVWRGGTTVAIAAAINAIAFIPGVAAVLFDHPELVLVEIALIFAIGTRMDWALLEHWNPREADEGGSRLQP